MLNNHNFQTAAGIAAASAQLDVRYSQGKILYDELGAVDIETHIQPPMILMREIKY